MDPPHLTDQLRKSEPGERSRLLRTSHVRRGQQARGAHEPDIVTPTPWWFEVARRQAECVLNKLSQAERDIVPPWLWPVAIWRKTGSPTITVAMRLSSLLGAVGEASDFALPEWAWDLPVVIEYHAFLRIVEQSWKTQLTESLVT